MPDDDMALDRAVRRLSTLPAADVRAILRALDLDQREQVERLLADRGAANRTAIDDGTDAPWPKGLSPWLKARLSAAPTSSLFGGAEASAPEGAVRMTAGALEALRASAQVLMVHAEMRGSVRTSESGSRRSAFDALLNNAARDTP